MTNYLPKASHWARGPREDEDFSPKFHVDVFEQVSDFYIPVFPMPSVKPKTKKVDGVLVYSESSLYAKASTRIQVERAAALHAPICLRGNQDVQEILLSPLLPLDDPGKYANKEPGDPLSPRCWAPDDSIAYAPSKKLSPFSNVQAWYEAGRDFGRLQDWKELAELYPAPPKVQLLFNNETSPAVMLTPVNDARLFDRRYLEPSELASERAEHILDGYHACFSAFFDGLKHELTPEWASVIETIGYWNLEHIPIDEGSGLRAMWETASRGTIALRHYDVASLEVYNWTTRDTLANVLPEMHDDVCVGRDHGTRYEVSVWDAIDKSAKLRTDPDQPVRYRRLTTAALWLIRAETLRGYRNHATDRADLEDDFWTAIIGPIQEVRENKVLRFFWENTDADDTVKVGENGEFSILLPLSVLSDGRLIQLSWDGLTWAVIEHLPEAENGTIYSLEDAEHILGLDEDDDPGPIDEDDCDCSGLEEEISSLNRTIDVLRSQVMGLEGSLGSANQRIGELEAELSQQQALLDEAVASLDSVEGRLSNLIDDVEEAVDTAKEDESDS